MAKDKGADGDEGLNVFASQFEMPKGEEDATPIAEDTGEGDGEEKKGPTTDELMRRLDEQQKHIDRLQRNTIAMMGLPAPTIATPAAPKSPNIDLSGLPDPLEDRDGYNKGIAERVQSAITDGISTHAAAERTRHATAASRDERIGVLWGDFSNTYPELAANEEWVEFAASKVAKRAKARGLDVEKYMFGNSEQFMEDVAAEIGKVFKPDTSNDGSDKNADTNDSTPSRTGGMFGGGGSTGTDKKVKKAKGDDMLEVLAKEQRAMGIY